MRLSTGVPLAPLTTLGLGGPARAFVEATAEAEVAEAVRWAAAAGLPLFVLGGGSNVVIADAGFPGLVLKIALRGVRFEPAAAGAANAAGSVLLHAAAGEPWDPLVDAAVARELGGIECLAGIPGLAGGTPIQNVGAYGQEVAETIHAVRALDRGTGAVVTLGPADCAFGYRTSAFKRHPGRHVVLAVTFALRPGGAPALRYPELAAALADRTSSPTLTETAAAVRAIRRRKSMVLDDPADPNRRSVGSFFTNPVLPAAEADAVADRAVAQGLASERTALPRFSAGAGAGPGLVKLPAAWLIERAGFARGYRRGNVGISSHHALALVHHGGGTAADLLALAGDIAGAVRARFGVSLELEPTVLNGTAPMPGG